MHFPFSIQPTCPDEAFMLEALKEAWKAFQKDEVPIGAVLVKEERVIARGHNQVELLCDATAHAEMICLTAGEMSCHNWRLANTTLYTTLEPCTMCAGAILQTRVPRLVWGAPDLRQGANGSWIDVFETSHPMHQISITKGVLASYSQELLQTFFKKIREKKGMG